MNLRATPRRGGVRRLLASIFPLKIKTLAHSLFDTSKPRRVAAARRLSPLKRRLGLNRRPEGVNLVAYIRAEMGLGEAARGLATALEGTGIPFNVINLEHGNPGRHADLSWAHREAPASGYDVTVVSVNPDNTVNLLEHTPTGVLGDSYVVGNWYWELPEFPEEWMHAFAYVNEVWAPTRFIQEAVALKSPVPVVRVPPVVNPAPPHAAPRSHFGLPDRRFLFLTMFDVNSVPARKNPVGVLRAFTEAFPRPDEGVGLVLKVSSSDRRHPFLRTLAEEVAGRDDLFVIDRLMGRGELNSLISLCDCFVSLHRSEGFGLGPAEAMYFGKPVIVTDWSGNTDYMTKDNSIGIDYRLVRVGQDYGPYKAHQLWAEPDVGQAAHWMKRVSRDRALAERIGGRGRETITSAHSPEAVGETIRKRLEYIRRGL